LVARPTRKSKYPLALTPRRASVLFASRAISARFSPPRVTFTSSTLRLTIVDKTRNETVRRGATRLSQPCTGYQCSGRDAVESHRGLVAAEDKAGRRTCPFTQGRNNGDVVELLKINLKRRAKTLVETGMKTPQDHAKKAECKTRKTMSLARKVNRAKHSQTKCFGEIARRINCQLNCRIGRPNLPPKHQYEMQWTYVQQGNTVNFVDTCQPRVPVSIGLH
jgi:hypothetical protein